MKFSKSFIPLIVASLAAVGAIIVSTVRKASRKKSNNDGGNFKSDNQGKEDNTRF